MAHLFTLVIRKISCSNTLSHRLVSHVSSSEQPSKTLSMESLHLHIPPHKTNYKVMSRFLINNHLASAEIDIYFGPTSLLDQNLFFFSTFPLRMTSSAHTNAKCSVTISEIEKKIHYYSILLGQQNSAIKKEALQFYLP